MWSKLSLYVKPQTPLLLYLHQYNVQCIIVIYIIIIHFLPKIMTKKDGRIGVPINTCSTDNDVTYINMPRIAQECSIYLFPLWSFHNQIADLKQ